MTGDVPFPPEHHPPPVRNGGGTREKATWALGAAGLGFIASFGAAVQIIQEPLKRDIISLEQRLEAQIDIARLDREEMRQKSDAGDADILGRSDERMKAAVAQQAQINAA